MKNVKKLVCILTASAVLLTGLGMHAYARDITILLDGEYVTCPVPAKIENGTTMVPMRAIFEALDMTVSWDNSAKTVTAAAEGVVIKLTVGELYMECNGEKVDLPVAPYIENGTTMVPVRAISESVNAKVNWNSFMRRVQIVSENYEIEDPDAWKENTGTINLTDLSVTGEGIYVDSDVVYITDGGDFEVIGENDDAMIYVSALEKVKLRLSGMKLTNKTGPAIFFDNCEKAFITVSKNTENYVSDGSEYDVDAKAAIFANDDLEIKGSGTLTVNGNMKHAIASDDDVKIEEGTLVLVSKAGDGIHANNTIKITDGNIKITAYGDGIQAEEDVVIEGGIVDITTNGAVVNSQSGGMGEFGGRGGNRGWQGTQNEAGTNPQENNRGGMQRGTMTPPEGTENTTPPAGMENMTRPEDMGNTAPPEGMEGMTRPEGMEGMTRPEGMGNTAPPEGMTRPEGMEGMTIPEGMGNTTPPQNMNGNGIEQTTSSEEDNTSTTKGIKGETDITISGGSITVNSVDDAIHCGGTVNINGGEITLNSSVGKGISAHGELVINDGTLTVEKATEGLEGKSNFTINGGTISINASDDGINAGGTGARDVGSNAGHDLTINGGKIYVNASADGLDANGGIVINGGDIVVNGPTNSGNGALDSGSSIVINGGTLLALGASGMAESPSGESTQPSFSVITSANMAQGTPITIKNAKGEVIYSYTALKSGNSIVFSSDKLTIGETYTVIVGEEEVSVNLTSVSVGSRGGNMGGFGGGNRGQRGW